jgi:hypothetical protein
MAKDTSQVGLRLPNDVLKKLQREGEGVSEAIRRRLDWTFELDKYANEDRELMHAVLHLSRQVRLHTGISWNENNGVRAALMSAINDYTFEVFAARLTKDERPEDDHDISPDELAKGGFKDKIEPLLLGSRLGRAYIRLLDEITEEDDETNPR